MIHQLTTVSRRTTMKRTTHLMIWTVAAAALTLSACSRENDSITGPSATAETRLVDRQLTAAEAVAPLAPDTVFVSVNATDMISIAFEDVADNEDGYIVHYIEIDTTAANFHYGPHSEMRLPAFRPTGSDLGWVTAEITGLQDGLVYLVWVEAYNSAGSNNSKRGKGGTKCDETPDIEDLLPPRAPRQLFVSVNATDMISIAFEDVADNEEGFIVYYHTIDTSVASPGYGPLQQMQLPAFDPAEGEMNWVTADILGLEDGCIFKVWVEAFNAAGSAQSARAVGGTKFDEEEDDDLIVQRERDVYRAVVDAS